jgi:aminopeptidase N
MPTKNQIIEGFSSAEANAHFPPDIQLEPFHQTVKLTFDLGKNSAWGSCATTIHANSDNGKKIIFDAVDFSIKSIKGVDSHSYDGEKITLVWNTRRRKGRKKK